MRNASKNDETSAINKYGDKGKYGVVEIVSKADLLPPVSEPVTIKSDKVFTKLETPAKFPGGDIAWVKYITKVTQSNINSLLNDRSKGTCIVKFIVDIDGSISNVETVTLNGTKLAELAIDAIKKGPRWIPGMQNGHIVASYKEQPVTFKIDDNVVNVEQQ